MLQLAALLLTAILMSATASAQQPTASSQPQDGVTSPEAASPPLPVSVDKIRQALEQRGSQSLSSLGERPHFRVEIRERQKIEELLSTLNYKSGPTPPGGVYGYEQQQVLFPKVQNPLAQPYATFNQPQLATILIEELLEKYLGSRMTQSIGDASRARAEQTAREEMQRALDRFLAAHPQDR